MFHGVQFYDEDTHLCQAVSAFFARGLLLGHPVLGIATPTHRAGIEAQLSARGFHVPALVRARQLTLLDAVTVLAELTPQGPVDDDRLIRLLAPLIERVEAAGAQLHAYGEMVDLLWKRGQAQTALSLEAHWSAAVDRHHFRLLCGYSRGNGYIDRDVDNICAHHSHVICDASDASLTS